MNDIKGAIEGKVIETLDKFENVLNTRIPIPNVHFDVRGTRSGYSHFSKGLVNFNIELAKINSDDFVSKTVPHEVAHWVQRFKYGYVNSLGKKITPHGKEWKYLMRSIGLNPVRCHSYDVTNVKTKQYKTVKFACSCQTFNLTMIRYNRYLKGTVYTCKRCKSPITPA